jgi:NADPH-dependent 2,4-dienoyl-CoA reductase/sulfur reductase-like enzyme
MQPMGQPSGGLVTLAAAIKREVRVPVLTAGKIDAALAERIIREGKADLVSMGRGLIADPDLPAKAREGRTAEIRPCLYCNYCISQRTRQKRRVRCTVNAAAGREREFKISPAAKKREVVVIGGGPAGLECAKVLRIRGHEVTLLEKRDRLGGQGWLASLPPGKEAIMGFISLLDREVRQLGVRVECSREIGPKEIDKLKADAVVLASGSSPVLPDIPGTKNANVTTGFSVLENGGQGLGKRIAVIGGGDVGCEVAEYLAHQGKTVTLIEQLEAVGLLLEPYTRRFFMERLSRCAIEVRLNQRVTSLQGSQVHCVDPRGGTSCIECDHVVMCVGTRANRALLPAIAAHFQEVYAIGDCMNPKNIFQAVSDGGRIGRRI